MRILFSIIFLLVLMDMSGCSRVWTREFILPEEQKKFSADGWEYQPRFIAYKNVGGERPWKPNEFSTTDFWVTCHTDKSDSTQYDMLIDTIHVEFVPSGQEFSLVFRSSQWLSYPSEDYLMKVFHFNCPDSTDGYLYIPEDIDTLMLDFDAVFRKGKLWSYRRGSVPYDTIIVPDTAASIRKPVQMMLIRHDDISHAPFFLIG